MTPERLKIINYVGAASDLAETLKRNLESKKQKITSETVVCLAKFYKAANDMKDLLDVLEADKKQIQ